MADPFTIFVAGAAFKYTKDYLNQRTARKNRAQYLVDSQQSPPQSSTHVPLGEEPEHTNGWCSLCNESYYHSFEHRWLEESTTEFRIIELEPGEGEEPLILNLVSTSIFSSEDYEALHIVGRTLRRERFRVYSPMFTVVDGYSKSATAFCVRYVDCAIPIAPGNCG